MVVVDNSRCFLVEVGIQGHGADVASFASVGTECFPMHITFAQLDQNALPELQVTFAQKAQNALIVPHVWLGL